MTVGNRSGAAHDGAQSQVAASQGAGAAATGEGLGDPVPDVLGDPVPDVLGDPVPDVLASWPGSAEAYLASQAAEGAGAASGGAAGASGGAAGASGGAAGASGGAAGASGDAGGEMEAAGTETPEEVPFWDLSAPEDGDDPPGGFRWEHIVDEPTAGRLNSEPAAEGEDPPRPELKAVVTPVEETDGAPRPPGIGQHRGNLAHLAGNPRMRVWRIRIIVAVLVMVGFSILASWQLGLTLAVVVVIADTIYRSRKNYYARVKMTRAQRRTRRQLNKLGRRGYRAMHASAIPGSEDQIDHLVVGPPGVFAIDSEAWDRHLIVRTKKGTQLWVGPFSKKHRLEHAQWEAQRASDLLSGEIGSPVRVRPAMAVYGPKIPWDVATIRDVDVFSGPRLRKYLRRRARQQGARSLSGDEIERIFKAADKAFPHLSPGSPVS